MAEDGKAVSANFQLFAAGSDNGVSLMKFANGWTRFTPWRVSEMSWQDVFSKNYSVGAGPLQREFNVKKEDRDCCRGSLRICTVEGAFMSDCPVHLQLVTGKEKDCRVRR